MEQAEVIAPAWYAVIPFIGFALLVILSVAFPFAEDRDSAAKGWPLPSAAALAFFSLWCMLGNYSGDRTTLIIYTVVLTVSGFVASRRAWFRDVVARGGRTARIARDVLCLGGTMLCCFLALELPWNTSFPALVPVSMVINLVLIALIELGLFFLSQRAGTLVWVGIVLAGLAGISNSFLIKFKGVALLPSDLLAMGTAFAVSEGYSYVMGGRQLWGIMAGAIGFALTSCLGENKEPREITRHVPRSQAHLLAQEDVPTKKRSIDWRRVLGVLLNLVLAAACAAGVYFGITRVSFTKTLGVNFDYWHTVERYQENGFLTSFVAAWQDFPIKRPKGYNKTKAAEAQEQLLARYESELAQNEGRKAAEAQFAEEKPSIVVVMNETFSDLSVFDGVGAGYEGPEYFRSIPDALLRGELAVSVIGGGTCNTEFEFLTGNSYAFIGAGKYPYVTYDLTPLENLAKQLGELGYDTHAIHPNEASNWRRDEVYADLGFGAFHAIDEFEGAPELHMGVTDAATYDMVLKILGEGDAPKFIFDVTMQNHSSYNLDNIPDDLKVNYQPEGDVDEKDVAQLNEYLACIKASDSDLKAFMEKLAKLDQKVVLVFFGDHQPAFTPIFNDLYFTDEPDIVHQQRTHQTGYFVWANYDVAGNAQESAVDDTSSDALGAMTLSMVGAPLTDYQKQRLAARLDVRAINLFGYKGADGVWYGLKEDSDYKETADQIGFINYLNFGSRVKR